MGSADTSMAGAVTFDTSQGGTVHDAKYDGSARRLATASSDGVVRVWGQSGEKLADLRGHKAPAMSLSWSQGRYAGLLASGASDGHVIFWREVRPQEWQIVHQLNVTRAANTVSFCAPEYGLALAVAGGDDLGVVTVLVRREQASVGGAGGDQWQVRNFPAHDGGVIALSWGPSASAATLATGPAVSRAAPYAPCRLATCGADGAVSVWSTDANLASWKKLENLTFEGFRGMPRDVAWRPNIGLPSSLVAACTDQGAVAIWVQDMDGQPWRLRTCWLVEGDARRLAWSRAGVLLAVSIGDDGSALYRESMGGEWELVSNLEEE